MGTSLLFVGVTSVVVMTHLVMSQPCVKTGPCSCRYSNGTTVDLSPLANGTAPRFKDMPDGSGEFKYSWSPCVPFQEGGQSSDCTNVAVCQLSVDNIGAWNLGTQDSAQFINRASDRQLLLQYTGVDSVGMTRVSRIILKCNPSIEGKLTVQGETSVAHYHLQLQSRYACGH